MSQFFLKLIVVALLFLNFANANAAICKRNLFEPIRMDDGWYKKEALRFKLENELVRKYGNRIVRTYRDLRPEKYVCAKDEVCDPIRNCQIEDDVDYVKEVEYLIKIDSGFFVSKSYCSVIGKCVGYNDFEHNQNVTAQESRIIDIRENNVVFYNYFYSAHLKNYKPPFSILNLRTGKEFDLNDVPKFSPDNRFIVEVRSSAKQENQGILMPVGFNINIYELGQDYEYRKIEGDEFEKIDPKQLKDKSKAQNIIPKVVSTFLSRNPECGPTPYFHSWKSNTEVRLSMLPPKYADYGRKAILFYDKEKSKWECREDLYPESECKSFLPTSTRFSSNLTDQQVSCQ